MTEKKMIHTDVLVVGGGMAGWFAAENARLQGADVYLADKGRVGMTGQSPYAHGFAVFNEEWGDDLKQWSDFVHKSGEYINNVYWYETVLKNSYARYQDLEFEGHEGKGPFMGYVGTGDDKVTAEVVSGATLGMSIRKGDGLWPKGEHCETSLPGLYAAGDALGTLQDGAIYTMGGGSMCGCAVTGAIAGEAAAKEALQMKEAVVSSEEIKRAESYVTAPLTQSGGYSPRWAAQVLASTMAPYFIYSIKKADRLEAALTYVMFLKDHISPMLVANDRHELRLVHETRSMILSAEMRLRSGLFRTERSGMHYREDYPFRDDDNWLCWTKIVNADGAMKLVKVPIPEEWRPDPSLPYEERYPYRIPGEEKYISRGEEDGDQKH